VADDSDLERTEPPSLRRLEQAREEGQVPQSRELSSFLVMMSGAGILWTLGTWFLDRVGGLVRHGLSIERSAAFDAGAMGSRLVEMGGEALLTLAPLLIVLIIASLAGPFVLGGGVFAPKVLAPDFSRLDPLQGLRRILSVHGLAELVKALAKAGLIGAVTLWVVWREHEAMFALLAQPLEAALAAFGRSVLFATIAIIGGMALIAAIDVPFQLWEYYRKLRMSKEELRREAKEQEGDPQVKGRIRSQQREMARRRMMAEVPKADVVVTNPSRYAVALRYEAARDAAPRVVAKGANEVAARIRALAREHRVPLLEAPALARALHRHTDLGEQVPVALYAAVAEVMAWAYQLGAYLKGGGLPPREPQGIAVPTGMDPGAA
jgi:flagellar biosynthetic protein FlhB